MTEEFEDKYFYPEEKKLVEFLYNTKFGEMTLELLTKPVLSKAAAKFFDSGVSRYLIEPYIKNFGINKEEAEEREYTSFNDFFTRKLKEGCREVDTEKSHLISPCDGYLSVFEIDGASEFFIKNFNYSVKSLTKSQKASEIFEGGYCAVLRLSVSDYHRYIYIDDCKKSENRFIEGVLHTVLPEATEKRRVYTENCREVCVMDTENFGKVAQIEVGALLVGRIENHHGKGEFSRGEEKGMFLYGGSTIVLLFEKDKVKFDEELLEFSSMGFEKKVKLGEMIGEKC